MGEMNLFFDLKELEKIKGKLKNLDKKLSGAIIKRAVTQGGQVLLAEAKRKAPILKEQTPNRKAGLLSKKIKLRVKKSKKGVMWAKVYVPIPKNTKKGGNVGLAIPYYWRFVEYGTVNMQARPFLRPTFDSKKDEAVQVVINSIKNEVIIK